MSQLELISSVLRIISDEFDIEYEDMYRYIKLRMKLKEETTPPKLPRNFEKHKCIAYVKNEKGITQCDRGQSCSSFCKTHFKQYNEGKLKYGCVKNQDEKKDICVEDDNSPSKTIRKVEKISLSPDHHLYRDTRTGQIYIEHMNKLSEVSVH